MLAFFLEKLKNLTYVEVTMNLKTVLGGCIGIDSIMLVGCAGEESDPSSSNPPPASEIGRASCRERGSPPV